MKGMALKVAAPVVMLVAFVAAPLPSFADDPTATAVTGSFTDIGTSITTIYIPALLALVAIGIGLKVGLKYLNKGSSKV